MTLNNFLFYFLGTECYFGF